MSQGAKIVTRDERSHKRKNMKKAYHVLSGKICAGAKVLVLDKVMLRHDLWKAYISSRFSAPWISS